MVRKRRTSRDVRETEPGAHISAHSRSFKDGVDIAPITILLRRNMSRCLFKGNLNADGSRAAASFGLGIGRAARSCLTDTDYITGNKCDMFDYVLRD